MKDGKEYTYRSIRDERQYGFFWYSALWRVLRPVLVTITVLVLTVGICMTVWNKLYGEFAAPADQEDPSEYTFEITSGQSLNRVASNLESAGLIRSKTVFKYYCDFAGMGQKIQVGTYALRKNMTMTEIAEQLTAGDGIPLVRNITLIPGETVEDFAAKLVKNGTLETADRFLELCRSGKEFSEYYYVADVLTGGNAAQRKYVLEGYLAPNTYEVYTNATEEDIIRKLLSQTEAEFPEEYSDQAEVLGLSMDQVLTMASLIEKEALDACYAAISPGSIDRASRMLLRAGHIYCHAIGDTYISVTAFANMLMKLGIHCLMMDRYGERMSMARGMQPGDLALIVSYSGGTLPYLRPEIDTIKARGGKIILVSTLDECPGVDHFVTLPDRESSMGKAGGFFSQTAIRYVLDSLYGTIYALDLERNQERKDRIEAAWQV